MAKAELGTKRVCPETDRKFYDLNRDPIVSPYSGHSYPLSFFETPVEEEEPVVVEVAKEDAETKEDATETTTPELDEDGVEIVSLEDADDETAGAKDIPGLEDDEDDETIGAPADDTFLVTDDDDDDVSDLVVVADDGDDT